MSTVERELLSQILKLSLRARYHLAFLVAESIGYALVIAPAQLKRTCATCHAVLADGPQPAATYQAQLPPIACADCANTGWCHANDKCYLKGVSLASTSGPAQQTWQPIETAPKDGTWILVWETGINTKYCNADIARFVNSRWENSDRTLCNAAHWRPVPAGPAFASTEERSP